VPAYKVSITQAAERDIEECIKYISMDDPAAAGIWLDEILGRIGSLEKYPARAPRIPESCGHGGDYRHLVLGKYRILFRIKGKNVVIVRAFHAARLLDLNER
jgi:plasmid stabilization system protein ParE